MAISSSRSRLQMEMGLAGLELHHRCYRWLPEPCIALATHHQPQHRTALHCTSPATSLCNRNPAGPCSTLNSDPTRQPALDPTCSGQHHFGNCELLYSFGGTRRNFQISLGGHPHLNGDPEQGNVCQIEVSDLSRALLSDGSLTVPHCMRADDKHHSKSPLLPNESRLYIVLTWWPDFESFQRVMAVRKLDDQQTVPRRCLQPDSINPAS